MRTDASVSRNSFRYSDQWRVDPFANVRAPAIDQRLAGSEVVDGRLVIHSLSGHERNHLFMNQSGEQFADMSLVSGLDNPADSRGFALFDYDHDGQQDIALVNANDPLLNLYHNQIEATRADAAPNRFIAIRFVGGNQAAAPSELACRDGFGALVEVKLDQTVLKREHRCGEGYGTQNSNTLIIGIGTHDRADSVSVRWPSGKRSSIDNIEAGKLLTVYENPTDDSSFVAEDYSPVTLRPAVVQARHRKLTLGPLNTLHDSPTATPKPRLFVTTATWCVACVEHLPHLRDLANQFGSEIQIVGLPVDRTDTPQKLTQYADEHDLPYSLVLELSDQQRNDISATLVGIIPADAVPASILTDGDGNVLMTSAGVPTVSELKQAIMQ